MVRTLAITNAKGGVGKTKKATNTAICAAGDQTLMRGNERPLIAYIDLDGVPGASRSFARFDKTGLLARAAADPFRCSVFRLFTEPEKGLNGIALEYDLREAILSLPQITRFAASKIDSSTIVERTLAAYDFDLDRLGTIILIPNAGSFELLVNQLNARASADRSFRKEMVLYEALQELEAARARQGLQPITLFILDCAGELGLLPTAAAGAATTISIPFQTSDLALEGAEETAVEINRIQRLRGDGFPRILSAIPTMVPVDEPDVQEWIAREATPRLATLNVPVSQDIVPFSYDIFSRANRKQVSPWEYNPCDPANLADRASYLRDREAIFAVH